jgi:AcrB/AcrD/AcrF family protein/YtkA-like protein
VRYAPEYREEVQTLADVLVTTPSGQQVPLAQVARFEQTRGAAMISSENGLLLATVLLNVQGRDVGGFVEDAKGAVASQVALPPGYFIGWSGQYENQLLARQRLQIIIPIVLVVIFALLYFTYHSALEAAHVLLTVPFALTGGVYLLWMLGYNFSVAVWVGFIALFGTAVQTAVVMVIYLDEAVRRRTAERRAALTRQELREAVMEGALLRLRPKVMTVSTVVAGLLPIMWTDRVGAEVMKPLATPVLGGMVSSLFYVLIVTPVLFYWIQERRLAAARSSEAGLRPLDLEGRETRPTYNDQPAPVHDHPAYVGRVPPFDTAQGAPRVSRGARSGPGARAIAVVALVAIAATGWFAWTRQIRPAAEPTGTVLERVQSGDLVITLSNPAGELRLGSNRFRLEFRSARTNELVDVGTVQLAGSMPMGTMTMSAAMTVTPTGTPGVYDGDASFGMAGSWPITIEWDGPAGRGTAAFEGDVR